MRSFTPKTIALTTLIALTPFAGAYAAGHHSGASDEVPAATFYGPRIQSVTGQIQGIDSGVADALRSKEITPAQAHGLEMRAATIERNAERVAAADHGRLPAAQYRAIEHRVDHLDQRLMNDTGSGTFMGDGADGGVYPNG